MFFRLLLESFRRQRRRKLGAPHLASEMWVRRKADLSRPESKLPTLKRTVAIRQVASWPTQDSSPATHGLLDRQADPLSRQEVA